MSASKEWHEKVLQALHDRLDEIDRERQQEVTAFQANSQNLEPPKDSQERLDEVASIHVAMEKEYEAISELEAEEAAAKATIE